MCEGLGSEEGETPTNQAIDITLPVWSIEVENIGWSSLRIFVPSLHGGIYQSLAQRSIWDSGVSRERRGMRENELTPQVASTGRSGCQALREFSQPRS